VPPMARLLASQRSRYYSRVSGLDIVRVPPLSAFFAGQRCRYWSRASGPEITCVPAVSRSLAPNRDNLFLVSVVICSVLLSRFGTRAVSHSIDVCSGIRSLQLVCLMPMKRLRKIRWGL